MNYTDAELKKIETSTAYSSRITELALIEDVRAARAEAAKWKDRALSAEAIMVSQAAETSALRRTMVLS